jgi:hypothetical protein
VRVCVYQCMYFTFLLFKLSSCRHLQCHCISINKLQICIKITAQVIHFGSDSNNPVSF